MTSLKLNWQGALSHQSQKAVGPILVFWEDETYFLWLVTFIYVFMLFLFYHYRVTETILRTLVAVPDAGRFRNL